MDNKKYTGIYKRTFLGKDQLSISIGYKNGLKNGKQQYWFENGKPEFMSTWVNGKLEGILTEWFNNGLKKWELNLTSNRKQGFESAWNIRGQKIAQGVNKSGKPWKGRFVVKTDKWGELLHEFTDGAKSNVVTLTPLKGGQPRLDPRKQAPLQILGIEYEKQNLSKPKATVIEKD
ncbi:MAG: hypothetical protein HRT89_20955 [Lentisphaeria bacterium]|nr:hypothetical protein [Lentisphaeria bacterium]